MHDSTNISWWQSIGERWQCCWDWQSYQKGRVTGACRWSFSGTAVEVKGTSILLHGGLTLRMTGEREHLFKVDLAPASNQCKYITLHSLNWRLIQFLNVSPDLLTVSCVLKVTKNVTSWHFKHAPYLHHNIYSQASWTNQVQRLQRCFIHEGLGKCMNINKPLAWKGNKVKHTTFLCYWTVSSWLENILWKFNPRSVPRRVYKQPFNWCACRRGCIYACSARACICMQIPDPGERFSVDRIPWKSSLKEVICLNTSSETMSKSKQIRGRTCSPVWVKWRQMKGHILVVRCSCYKICRSHKGFVDLLHTQQRPGGNLHCVIMIT